MHAAPAETPSKARVWIDDSDQIFRVGLGAILERAGFEIVGESSHSTADAADGQVDVGVQFDALVYEAERSGVELAESIAETTNCRLIALLRSCNDDLIAEAVQRGSHAVLLRNSLEPGTLIAAVGAAVSGTTAFPTEVFESLMTRAALGDGQGSGALRGRELDVLRHLSDGCDTREIAANLGYSERTVKNVVHDVLTKMNCRNRAHAVATAARCGLI